VEEIVVEVIQTLNTTELLQIMAIVSLNMGNLNLEVSSLKNKLARGEREEAILQEELDKEREF
jgi:hypothetical protein